MQINQPSNKESRGSLHMSIEFSLCSSLSSTLPHKFYLLKLPKFQALSPQSLRPLFSIWLLLPESGNCFSWKTRTIKGSPVLFHFIRGSQPTLPGVQCLKTVASQILSCFLVVYGGRLHSNPVIPPWLPQKSPSTDLLEVDLVLS